jgi:hypothetical protein
MSYPSSTRVLNVGTANWGVPMNIILGLAGKD